MSQGPEPGWYDHPDDPGRQRWWDGTQWGDHSRDKPTDDGPPPPDGGDPDTSQANTRNGCLAVIVLVVVIGVIASMCSSGDGGSGGGEIAAYVMCQQFVEDRLKAPSTAGFPLASDANITGGPTVWTVRSHVDSENSFGAEVRTRFTCRIRDNGDDSWTLESLTMDE